MVAAPKLLRDGTTALIDPHRARRLLPHLLVAPLRQMLLASAQQARAIGASVDYNASLWLEAADALDSAADLLRRAAR